MMKYAAEHREWLAVSLNAGYILDAKENSDIVVSPEPSSKEFAAYG